MIDIEPMAELELVRRARAGDESSFEEIVRRYTPRVFHIARRFFRRQDRIEEIAQDVFLKAYTQLASYAERGSFEGWLSRIATHTCLNELRRARRHPEAPVSELSEEETGWLEQKLAAMAAQRHMSAESARMAADLAERVLSTVSPDDRLVLTLMDGDELSVKEIAELAGWSPAKVKIQSFRARRRMRKAVEALLAGRSGP